MQQTQGLPSFLNMLPLLMIMVIFYFLLIKPQKQKEKERQQMLKNIKKNDEVVTTGGIHGTIVNVKDTTVVLRVDENVKFEVEKNCIGYVKKQTS
jgi:preprotein translocase subunit YajC